MGIESTVKRSQEQAIASWVGYLNQLRLNELLVRLLQQDTNLENALSILNELKEAISQEVVEKNRGGIKGMHGFIAERMQVYIENARKVIEGKSENYRLIDDNGPDDYLRNNLPIQQKFVQKNLSLDAISEHLKKYPDFLERGGKYQIPKDYYERIIKLLNMSENDAKTLDKESYRLYEYIQRFFKQEEITINDIEPTAVNYASAQCGKIDETINTEKKNVKQKDKEERGKAYQESKPNLKEGAKVVGVSAVAEGGMAFCMGVYKKIKQGKRITEFDEGDWGELGINTAKGAGKGAVRGVAIYGMTNFTATPAAVASSLVTAAFGIMAESIKLKNGIITGEDFLINSEVIALDVTVCAVSSVLGQTLIPIPVLGAIIGNVAGNFVYDIVKETISENEAEWIKKQNEQMQMIQQYLDKRYLQLVEILKAEFKKYKSLVDMAFSADFNEAFEGSVGLAQYVGVSEGDILKNMEDINNFFTR